MLLSNVIKQELKSEWSLVTILLQLKPLPKTLVFLKETKMNSLCKELILLNLLEVLFVRHVAQLFVIAQELLKRRKKNKNN
jgi:hypothetical protein